MKYVAIIAALFIVTCCPVSASEFTAKLQLRNDSDRELLQRLDISVDSIRGLTADAWLSAEEAATLESVGIAVEKFIDEAFLETDKNGLAKGYHTPESCVETLTAWATAHPEICSLQTIGYSVEERPIVALKVTKNPTVHGFKPLLRYCGAHHGNEIASSEVVIMFAEYLLDGYGSDATITRLVNEREIWLIPMVNPDGVARRSRYNANRKDLNRNYGYRWRRGWKRKAGNAPYSEPETRTVRDNALDNPFCLSLSFHCSGDIVNYLWNYTKVRCPDQDLILSLSNGYASFNGYEVTEGADWYKINGDTNDWAYGCTGSLDSTIEVANPSFSGVDTVFEANRQSMLYVLEEAGKGVCGTVTDTVTGKPLRALVEAIPPGWPAFTHPVGGDFHRPLLPGTYTLRVWAPGHAAKIIENVVVGEGNATQVDVSLDEAPGVFHGLNLCEAIIPDDSRNTTHGPHTLGPTDGRFCSLGAGGHVVLDLSETFPQKASANVTVTDCAAADDEQEGFTVATSTSPDGPWTTVGSGQGTATVHIDAIQRYIKITDETNKSRATITPGLDLDAITVELRAATQVRQFEQVHH